MIPTVTTMFPPSFLQLFLSLTTVNIFGVMPLSLEPCPEKCVCAEDIHQPGAVVVDCTNAGLSTLPQQFPKETHELRFPKNSLFHIDFSDVAVLSKLEKLDLSSCYLKGLTVPYDLTSSFPNLKILDLTNNDLDGVPKNLPQGIEILSLSHNSISDLPASFYLFRLKELFLDNNNISTVAKNAFSGQDGSPLSSLHKLALNSNRIKFIDNEAFNGLSDLSALTLSHNYLRHLDKSLFEKMTKLGHLDVSHNALGHLPPSIFKMITSLKFLDLSANHLVAFPVALPMLEWLDVSQNIISHIPEAAKSDIYPIEALNLARNPFDCDCRLLWLKQLFERREYLLKHLEIHPEDYVPTCASPASLAGMAWNTLKDDAFQCTAQGGGRVEAEDAGAHDAAVRTRAGLVTDSSVQILWSTDSPSYTSGNIVIQYYVFSHRSSMKYVEIAAAQRTFVLKNLKPQTNYVICIMPKAANEQPGKRENSNPSIVLDDCIEVATKEAGLQPRASRVEIVFYYALGMFATFIGTFATIGCCALLYGIWNHKNTHWSAKYVTDESYLDGSTYATDEPVTTEKKEHCD